MRRIRFARVSALAGSPPQPVKPRVVHVFADIEGRQEDDPKRTGGGLTNRLLIILLGATSITHVVEYTRSLTWAQITPAIGRKMPEIAAPTAKLPRWYLNPTRKAVFHVPGSTTAFVAPSLVGEKYHITAQ